MSDSLPPHRLYSSWNSQGHNIGVGSFFLFRDLPNPVIEPRSPTMQADSLPAEPQGKPKNTGVGSLSPCPAALPNPISECRGLLHCRQILYQLSLDLELCPGISQGSNTNLLLPLFLSTYTILSLPPSTLSLRHNTDTPNYTSFTVLASLSIF